MNAADLAKPADRSFRLLVEKLWDAMVLLDRDAAIRYVAPSAARVLDREVSQLVGRHVLDVVHPADRELLERTLTTLLDEPGAKAAAQFRCRDTSGAWIWLEAAATNLLDEPEVGAVVCRFHDVTERRRAELSLAESEERYRVFVSHSSEGIWRIEITVPIPIDLPEDEQIALMFRNAYFAECNVALARMYGFDDPSALVGARLTDFYIPTDETNIQQLRDFIRSGYRLVDGESREIDKDGNPKHFLNNLVGVVEKGLLLRAWGTQRDITERKRAEEALRESEARLSYRSRHDALTNLPNRTHFLELLERAGTRFGQNVAAVFVDVDRFKVINETLGHTVGDRLLVALAERLERCIGPRGVLARLGGDEFAVLIEDVRGQAEAVQIAERVLHAFRHPFAVEGHVLLMTVSIGVAVGGAVGGESDNLLRQADVAMCRAKATGKGKYVVYDTSLHDRMVRTLRLEADLRGAVERGQFVVHYQPIVALESGTVVGFEALVRWNHPALGLVRPMDFIPVAEEAGLILPVDRWVLREACQQLRAWQLRLGGCPPLTMSVNFSSRQFSQADVVEAILGTLADANLAPEHLKIEITENALIEHADTVSFALSDLQRRGVRVVLDDFGTGFSSLSYLHRFPVDLLKIDRSFVSGMEAEANRNVEIVRAIANLAQNLGVEVVAEGIETSSQVRHLRALGCGYGQGFYYSRPVAAGEALALALAHAAD